jgi:hypothetical protein
VSIANEPHCEVSSAELAAWIDRQGADCWWNVDGDPFLTGHLMFPCPGDELADELRRINRPLLVQDPQRRPTSRGQTIGRDQLDELVGHLGDPAPLTGPRPAWVDNRILLLCWKGTDEDWLLVEDRETTERSREDFAAGKGRP